VRFARMSFSGRTRAAVPFGEAVRTWCRVAALSFGGPAGQIAVMHRILVEEKRWISEERFVHALNYCMLLPGPEAQQLATYVGWLLHRIRGGLVAGVLFVLPGFLSILVLSVLYAHFQQTHLVQALFFGVKPAVLAIVLGAVWRIGVRVLRRGMLVAVAAAAFAAVFLFQLPFPLLIVSAGLFGFVGGRLAPEWFCVAGQARQAARQGDGVQPASPPGQREESERRTMPANSGAPLHASTAALHTDRPTFWRSVSLVAVFGVLWFGPLGLLGASLGWSSVYAQQGIFFSKAAVVTFGGAYAVLSYIGQQAVERYGWLQPGEMLDGLGMAETTPGPLIQVVQFVSFLGAYRNPGPFSPLMGGVVASAITTWVTYVPCFLWVFLGAPYVERLRGIRSLQAALSTITAAVAGVMLNLAAWFSLHTLFADVETRQWLAVRLLLPVPESVRPTACVLAALALLLTFCYQRGMGLTLAVCGALGALLYRQAG